MLQLQKYLYIIEICPLEKSFVYLSPVSWNTSKSKWWRSCNTVLCFISQCADQRRGFDMLLVICFAKELLAVVSSRVAWCLEKWWCCPSAWYSPLSYCADSWETESLGGLMQSQILAGKHCSQEKVEFKCSQFPPLRGGLTILSSKHWYLWETVRKQSVWKWLQKKAVTLLA